MHFQKKCFKYLQKLAVKWWIITFLEESHLLGQEVEEDVGRVSPALTSVSVILNTAWWGLTLTLLHTLVYQTAYKSDKEVESYFKQETSLWNNNSSVTPTHHSLRGQKSHNHHPELVSSHSPPTCPQPAQLRKESHFVFRTFVPFISSPDSQLF